MVSVSARFKDDFFGSIGTTAATGALLAAMSTSVLIANTQEWSAETVRVADGALDEALSAVAVPPLRLVDAYATTDGSHLTNVRLVLQVRSGETVSLDDLRMSVQTADDLFRYEGTADRFATLRILRDPDGSLLSGVFDDEDLGELELPLGPLQHPIAAGTPFKVFVQAGVAPALEVPLEAPIGRLTGVVDLEIVR